MIASPGNQSTGRVITNGRAKEKNVKLLCVGKKGRDMLKREYGELIVEAFDFADKKNLSFKDVQVVGK